MVQQPTNPSVFSSVSILNRDVDVGDSTSREDRRTVGQFAIAKSSKSGQRWGDRGWVQATGRTLGTEQRSGENFNEFKDRVYTLVRLRINAGKADARKRTR